VRFLEPVMLPNGILPRLVKHFAEGSDRTGDLKSFRAIVKSITPDTDAWGESAATQTTLELNDQARALEFLKVTMFFVSNSFFDERDDVSKEIYSWLREQTNSQLLNYILSIKGPTAEALAENLFRLAIDAEDVGIVKKLLKTGLDPNEQVFRGEYRSALTPLQYTCQLRNPELAQALIDAGANVHTILHQGQGCALEYAVGSDLECSKEPTNVELVRILLRAGADVNPIEVHDDYPLTKAAERGEIEVVALLISAGADVNSIHTGEYGRHTALVASLGCARSVPDEDVIAIVQSLLNAGADVNLEANYEGDIVAALDSAVQRGSIKLVQLLLASRARVSESALGNAVKRNALDMVKLLLNAGAHLTAAVLELASAHADIELLSFLLDAEQNVTLKARYRSIALTGAIFCGKTDRAIKLADSGAQLYGNDQLADAITAASERGDIRVLRWLLDAGSGHRATAIKWLGDSLCAAISKHQAETATELLAAGANVNAVRGGDSALLLAIHQRNANLVRKLLRAGAVVNREIPLMCYSKFRHSTPFYTFTVLPAAVAWGDRSIIQDIIDAGADIDAVDAEGDGGKTALTVAVGKRDDAMTKFLIDAGADINNWYGRYWGLTPLEAAALNNDIDMVRYLLRRGADPSDQRALEAALWSGVELIQVLLGARCWPHVHCGKGYGGGALQNAIISKDPVVIETLLTNKIEVNLAVRRHSGTKKTRYGESALGTSIKEDKSPDLWIVQMILRAGGDPNRIVTETPKHSALLAAIEVGNPSLVKLLVEAGAEVNPVPLPGVRHTPLQLAADKGNMEILQILLKLGADVNAPPAERDGGTALQFAAIRGLVAMAYLLLNEGAEVNAFPAKFEGRTALEGAAEHGRIDMLQLLLNAGAEIVGPCGEQYARAVKFASENGHGAARRLLESYHAQWFESVANALMA
jgi:ankyrin repeat protein